MSYDDERPGRRKPSKPVTDIVLIDRTRHAALSAMGVGLPLDSKGLAEFLCDVVELGDRLQKLTGN